MSNLQDVPLAEPENMPPTEQNVTGNKSNSLKRFFKLGKKSNSSQDISADACEMVEDEANKDTAKPGSISRFLTRFKGTSKTENSGDLPIAEPTAEPTSSSPITVEEATERPAPNAKPTLKTSISSYWKLLFHRQKVANRQGADSEPETTATEQQMDIHEMQQIQQEQQTDPIKAEDAYTVTPATSRHDIKTTMPLKLGDLQPANCIPQILEEVQVLTVSDEIVDPSLEEAIQH